MNDQLRAHQCWHFGRASQNGRHQFSMFIFHWAMMLLIIFNFLFLGLMHSVFQMMNTYWGRNGKNKQGLAQVQSYIYIYIYMFSGIVSRRKTLKKIYQDLKMFRKFLVLFFQTIECCRWYLSWNSLGIITMNNLWIATLAIDQWYQPCHRLCVLFTLIPYLFPACYHHPIETAKTCKPWPNGHKLKLGSTCDSPRSGLSGTCVDLRWLALTLVEIKLHESRRRFFSIWSPNPSQRELSEVHSLILCNPLVNEIQDMSALKWFFFSFATCVYSWENLRIRSATQRISLRKFNLRLLTTNRESFWTGP